MRKIRAAVIQTVSGTNPAANTAAMRRLVRQAAEQGADWALLPEGEGVITAELDPARLNSVRQRLPALAHRIL